VGTGPYKFVSYKAGVEVKLTRFDDYYRGAARIKDVDYQIITDDNTATVNLRTGDVDAGSFARASYDEVMNEPALTVADWSANSLYYFAVNNEVAPFNDPIVRQAINYAIDREYIAEVETNGLSKITSVMLPPSVFGYSDEINQTYTYDPDKARELLKKAGIKTPMEIGTIKIPEGDGKNAAEALQQCLSEIGLEVEIEILEQNKFYDETDFGDYEIAWCQISLLRDADSYSILFTSDQIDGMNTARYSNPKVDKLFTQAKATTDQKERLRLYAEVFNLIGEDAAYIPVYVPTNIYAYNKNLKIDVLEPSVQFVYDMHWN
ncbi:MAG: ABC transporter substrate-binding protein, partial [Emergencia timonensis]